MADSRARRLEQGPKKNRTVSIAVTPEGFWCCPSPAVLQKTLKDHHRQTKKKIQSSVASKAPNPAVDDGTPSNPSSSIVVPEHSSCHAHESAAKSPPKAAQHRKISVGFGQPETSDLKIVLFGKNGIAVEMSVHRNILIEHSCFFTDKLSRQPPAPSLEIADCEDVEIFVETVGLMYCNEVKHRVIKQSVSRVLRILKV